MTDFRIPYKGGKQKIAKALVKEMAKHKPNAKYFIDLFGGGGSMSLAAAELGYNVLYNEKNEGLCNLLGYIQQRITHDERSELGLFPADWYEFVTREKFMSCKGKTDPRSAFALICYSFGTNNMTYFCEWKLYSRTQS